MLLAAGVAADEIDARAGEVATRAVLAYAKLCPADLSPRLAPGIVELLEALAARPDAFTLSLVTGNLEPVGRGTKSSTAPASATTSPPIRAASAPTTTAAPTCLLIARARMSSPPWPRERTVVIGDTPRAIACARADGVRVAAVATGPFAVTALADADAVADDARSLLPVLEDWL